MKVKKRIYFGELGKYRKVLKIYIFVSKIVNFALLSPHWSALYRSRNANTKYPAVSVSYSYSVSLSLSLFSVFYCSRARIGEKIVPRMES
jgi:hypothetical protein